MSEAVVAHPRPGMGDDAVPRLAPGVRLHQDVARGWVLLSPEQVTELFGPASEILRLCDGAHPVAAIVAELVARFPTACPAEIGDGVRCLLRALAERRLVVA